MAKSCSFIFRAPLFDIRAVWQKIRGMRAKSGQRGILKLGPSDNLIFAKAVIHPPKPNAALKRALKLHAKSVTMKDI
jgi:hypothetical protein